MTAINRLLKSINNIQQDINLITQKTIPVLENASNTMRRVDELSENIQREIDGIMYSIRSLKKIADDVVELETKIKQKVEEPLLDSISFFSGIIKGIKTFIMKMKS
ncbi:MAG: hypothetical protein IGBAC_1768 [Ignavibacteriae bacterium]|nr:MAG: hypothetical protein IGBAC_1768 [Ignavibacteriota bacterium]